ncbi:hypothetical protein ACFC1R_38285 [Kitasatospora sp. NPDC056138]|uniref:hypothetical protein n=1 Tax=Kitasatospora sp. NPDC056138 TaxID=3345724 RepID=UPI0035DF7BF3
MSALIRKLDTLDTPTQPEPQPPFIEVTFNGSISDAKFHVTGGGFLPNRPPTNQGVAIRVVDANALIETRREFTASSSAGAIDHVVEGDLTGAVLNSAGFATIAISATDGRSNPNDKTGFLQSNTVSKDIKA